MEIERDRRPVPASLVLPRMRAGRLPGWIVLGGITRMGRFHPQLVRFAHALAASGAAVLIPEVPEWRDLRLAPGVTVPTVRAAVAVLRLRAEVLPAPYGLMGFSFGAPQAVIAATHATLVNDIAGVAVFGGYCDLERTLRCQLTGCHDWGGVDHVLSPDPYGRWCVASNYLTSVAGFEDAGDVAGALRCLAIASTELRLAAWLPEHDVLKAELRSSLPQRRQHLFDLFAPPAGEIRGELHERDQMAFELAGACRRVEPLLDPAGRLAGASTPVRLIHGRGDRLVPFTESLRFHDRLPSTVQAHVTVTGLFAHSADVSPPSLGAKIWEGAVFFEALRGLINTV